MWQVSYDMYDAFCIMPDPTNHHLQSLFSKFDIKSMWPLLYAAQTSFMKAISFSF